ncbi:hypothetical protein CPTD_00554 [Corynebacterium pseudotuberculosis]|nr:hypothetical protein CPTA_00966 [Corynebacterium pseudotuberculosis]AIG08623.1 hypothetical protein CPTB_00567 [Corynebacterium pseudotuberculosis]AIG10515.1 hypothetical protein CPTC_00227 [Corynebacterium pseudotuberculosis]ATQ64754.1 Hypothetical protein CpPA07_0435 [Corynebacterium pseudotuberculosis]KEX88816.1 hypothetical protein CPTD_00554 [Corynebacterium pseudotuberculosis]
MLIDATIKRRPSNKGRPALCGKESTILSDRQLNFLEAL